LTRKKSKKREEEQDAGGTNFRLGSEATNEWTEAQCGGAGSEKA